jgi:hypothetical protein
MRRNICLTVCCIQLLATSIAVAQDRQRGVAKADVTRPVSFPHRVWAFCDFEAQQYAWFGPAVTDDVWQYPGNKTAMGVAARPYQKFAGIMTGINPVPGPMMGKENSLYLRYKLTGATEATFQHYSWAQPVAR